MINNKRDNKIIFNTLRYTFLSKAVACLLVFTFTITNVTYGYDGNGVHHLREISDRENKDDIAAIEQKIKEDKEEPATVADKPRNSTEAGVFPIDVIPFIQFFAFDIGDTLAVKRPEDPKGDRPTDDVISSLKDLLNTGRYAGILSAKAEKSFKSWVEQMLKDRKVTPEARTSFFGFGDRVTKVYRGTEDGHLVELSRIPFPSSADKAGIFKVTKAVTGKIQQGLLSAPDEEISPAIKDIIRNNPLKAKEGDEYIQLCSGTNIDIKGDKTSGMARNKLRDLLEAELRKVDLMTEDLIVVLDGKKGVYIKNKEATKQGAIRYLLSFLNLTPQEIAYVADQFAGKSIADLSVAGTGVYCLNVGANKQDDYPNVYNTQKPGPEGAAEFIRLSTDRIQYEKYYSPLARLRPGESTIIGRSRYTLDDQNRIITCVVEGAIGRPHIFALDAEDNLVVVDRAGNMLGRGPKSIPAQAIRDILMARKIAGNPKRGTPESAEQHQMDHRPGLEPTQLTQATDKIIEQLITRIDFTNI